MVTLSDNDLYYLRSIKRQLDEVKEALADTAAFSLGGMAFADNLDWLDCFIDKHTRRRQAMSKEDIDGIIDDIKQQLADSPDDDVSIDNVQAQALIECIESMQAQHTLSDPSLQAEAQEQDEDSRNADRPPVKPIPQKPVSR